MWTAHARPRAAAEAGLAVLIALAGFGFALVRTRALGRRLTHRHTRHGA